MIKGSEIVGGGAMKLKKRIGICGFGKLGQFLVEKLTGRDACHGFELAFVWNRNPETIKNASWDIPILSHLEDFARFRPDLIVEVAHPNITLQMGETFLKYCDFLIGSPTVFGYPHTDHLMKSLKKSAAGRAVCIAKGALVGLEDIRQAAATGRVQILSITMEKDPESIHFEGPLENPLSTIKTRTVLYQGSLGPLCSYAPNNVNTMAVAALAAGLSFQDVQTKLIATPDLDHHLLQFELLGPEDPHGKRFRLYLEKENPAAKGAVTGQATYDSFWNSVQKAALESKPGLHIY